eukprot:COSAG04_NODE_4183_length_2249_cov_2.506512_2_plen_255_part_00
MRSSVPPAFCASQYGSIMRRSSSSDQPPPEPWMTRTFSSRARRAKCSARVSLRFGAAAARASRAARAAERRYIRRAEPMLVPPALSSVQSWSSSQHATRTSFARHWKLAAEHSSPRSETAGVKRAGIAQGAGNNLCDIGIIHATTSESASKVANALGRRARQRAALTVRRRRGKEASGAPLRPKLSAVWLAQAACGRSKPPPVGARRWGWGCWRRASRSTPPPRSRPAAAACASSASTSVTVSVPSRPHPHRSS